MINKSILVLEENSVVHGLIASALDVDGLTLHHEFNPAKYVDRARNLKPDLILVSNADQFNNYSICRQLKTGPGGGTPLVLLANSRDALDAARLRDLQVDGVVRKPFEASDLQEQVSRHLHLPDLVGAAYEYRQSQSAPGGDVRPPGPVGSAGRGNGHDDEDHRGRRSHARARGGFQRGVER